MAHDLDKPSDSDAAEFDRLRASYAAALERDLAKLRRCLEAKGVSKIGPIWDDPPSPEPRPSSDRVAASRGDG